jgi:hypothetical protein
MYQRYSTPVNFKILQIITLVLPGGATLFLFTVFFLNQNRLVLMPGDGNSLIVYVALAFGGVFSILSNVLFKSLLGRIDTLVAVKEKFQKYVAAYITRYALIAGAALFNMAVFLLSGCLLNAIMTMALIIFMLAVRPQRHKTIEDLKIYYPDTLE